MRRIIVGGIAAVTLALTACGSAQDCVDSTTSEPTCDWETELWDGTTCLLRTDHEGHLGHNG